MKSVLTYVRRTALRREGPDVGDGELLEHFLARRDDAAFAALVRRHGPMVLSVARRVLGHVQDAEDVFQAVFLVLVKKAATVQRRELLANWLYGVAYRTALEARTAKARRRARETQRSTMPEPAVNTVDHADVAGEVPDIIDQELCRLPEKYRAAVVLCDVEGRPRKQAARQFRIPEGTLSSRLATARQRLARRLARRGVALSAGALAAALTHSTAVAAPSTALVSATVRTAALLSAGAPTASAVSAKVLTLFHGVLHAMFLTKLKNTALVLFGLCVLGVGLGLRPQGLAAGGGGGTAARSATAQDGNKTAVPAAADELQGAWKVLRVVADGEQVGPEKLPAQRLHFVNGTAYSFQEDRFRDALTYQLDAKQQPKTIDLTHSRGEMIKAIYSVNGDMLKMCMAKAADDDRPTVFESKAENRYILIVLQRDPKAPKLDLKKIEAEKLAGVDRQTSQINLKQLALAMHNYHDTNGSFPANAIYDGDGKPLLSWRVAILPYIDQKDLYDQFKLDQPWDSEHNKKLLEKMPEVYGGKGDKTFYQVFAGEGSVFDGKEGIKLTDITDGTSNTVLIAEAAQAVPWTKPADLPYKAGEKLPKLGGLFKEGFNVAFADGSVRFVSAKFSQKTMHALITRAGAEVVNFEDLDNPDPEERQEATKPAAIETRRP